MQKFKLGFFPTPLHLLKNFSAGCGGHNIYIKRDDHTGLASGGNKTRKLEYLIGEALSLGADTVITAGAQQSNHCRQTAAACAIAKLECHLLLRGEPPAEYNGNLLLSKLLGANIHFSNEDKKGPGLNLLAEELREDGRKTYVIPYGGSNLCGALGYAEAAGELKQQLSEQNLVIDYIFFASSSGGMQAGLTLGLEKHNLEVTLMPISIDKEETSEARLEYSILDILNQGKEVLKLNKVFSKNDITLIRDFNDAGYGMLTEYEKTAIYTLAGTEGILLDPVYTARAFVGMMHYLSNKKLKPNSNVLFWHTGGLPANFSYANRLY